MTPRQPTADATSFAATMKGRTTASGARTTITIITSFIFGLALASFCFLWYGIHRIDASYSASSVGGLAPLSPSRNKVRSVKDDGSIVDTVKESDGAKATVGTSDATSMLSGLRILVTIASYDFMQFAHLEEVLDGFQDLCYAGSKVDIVIYTTVIVSFTRIVFVDCCM